MIIQRESTEYVYIGVTGDVPQDNVEVAFLDAETRPTSADWEPAVKVEDDQHTLWNDANSSEAEGDWYAAVLIGDFGTEGIELEPGDYVVWLRFTDVDERPVRIVPTTLEVA